MDMDSVLVRSLLAAAVPLVVLPFMAFVYPPLAKFTVGEFFTSIVRRNKLQFAPVVMLPAVLLGWWAVQYQPWSGDWPSGEFLGWWFSCTEL